MFCINWLYWGSCAFLHTYDVNLQEKLARVSSSERRYAAADLSVGDDDRWGTAYSPFFLSTCLIPATLKAAGRSGSKSMSTQKRRLAPCMALVTTLSRLNHSSEMLRCDDPTMYGNAGRSRNGLIVVAACLS